MRMPMLVGKWMPKAMTTTVRPCSLVMNASAGWKRCCSRCQSHRIFATSRDNVLNMDYYLEQSEALRISALDGTRCQWSPAPDRRWPRCAPKPRLRSCPRPAKAGPIPLSRSRPVTGNALRRLPPAGRGSAQRRRGSGNRPGCPSSGRSEAATPQTRAPHSDWHGTHDTAAGRDGFASSWRFA